MASLERPLGDISNIFKDTISSPYSSSSSPTSTLKQDKVNIIQKVLSSDNQRDITYPDTEESLLTASESDAFTTEEEEDEDDVDSTENDSDGCKTVSNNFIKERKERSPPPIFFGTPSKAEHDRRHKYQAKLRTRRLLRKDSIELTRRKSGGWECHDENTAGATNIDEDIGMELDSTVNEGSTRDLEDCQNEDETAEQINVSITRDQSGKIEFSQALEAESVSPEIISTGEVAAVTTPSSNVVFDETSTEISIETSAQHILSTSELEEAVPKSLSSEAQHNSTDSVINEEDPDATEEAHWSVIRDENIDPAPHSSTFDSPPSTPTRQSGNNASLHISRSSLAPSDADSSPGIALAQYPFSSRPSPLNFGQNRSRTSPYITSPAYSYTSSFSPQMEQENAGRHSTFSSHPRSEAILRESPRKGNHATSSNISPLKVQVRSKLAAWADAKVKTPQSPEKKEYDALRSSAMDTSSFSPTLSSSRFQMQTDLLRLATQVPLPISPEKEQKVSQNLASSSHSSKNEHEATPSQFTSPSRLDGSAARTSRLPVPVMSKLPRPFKLSVVKPSIPNAATANTNGGPSKVFKTLTIFPTRQTDQVAKSTTNNGNAEILVSGKKAFNLRSDMRSGLSSSSSSSPSKQAVRSNAPIVRDARLIVSKHARPAITDKKDDIENQQDEVNRDVEQKESQKTVPQRVENSRVMPSKAGNVGGARRVIRDSKSEDSSSVKEGVKRGTSGTSVRSKPVTAVNANPNHRLGMRSISSSSQTSVTSAQSNSQSRPMRRMNDYVRKVEPSRSSPVRQQAVLKDTPDIPKREVDTESKAKETSAQKNHPDQKRSNLQETKRIPSNSSKLNSIPFKAFGNTSQSSKSNESLGPRPIPLSSMELSRLTSLHTRCNETGVAELELVIIRKQGENRPASPSTKFRKGKGNGVSMEKSVQREIQSKKARQERAEQRAERLIGDSSDNLIDNDKKDDPKRSPQRHILAAGDAEQFFTPQRRISLKKVVRWRKSLFAGPSDDVTSSSPNLKQISNSNHKTDFGNIKSCLINSNQNTALDRFGNSSKAGKPLGSPIVKREKIIVTKIVYDDDDEDY